MTTTLVETIQKNLGYPELCKIDPNTQAVKQQNVETSSGQLGQAAIPRMIDFTQKLVRRLMLACAYAHDRSLTRTSTCQLHESSGGASGVSRERAKRKTMNSSAESGTCPSSQTRWA